MNIKSNGWLITVLFLTCLVGVFSFFPPLGESVFVEWNQQANIIESLKAKEKILEKEIEKLYNDSMSKIEDRTVSLIAVGDIMLSRNVLKEVEEKGDINYPFLKTKEFFQGTDIVFGNLESPITEGRKINTGEMVFRTDPDMAGALKDAGFNILSLANNHTPNFGEKGLLDTFNYLNEQGIKYVGAGRNLEEVNEPVYFEVKGFKFAFLAYTDPNMVPSFYEVSKNRSGTVFMREDDLRKNIEEAKKEADFIIISMHSGDEYTLYPNKSQTSFAHNAIDFGADLVIGHHPHVVQSMEKYKDKYIFYSLGNFIFDQTFSRETQRGLIVKFIFGKKGVEKVLFLPTVIDGFSQPEFLDWDGTGEVLDRLRYPVTHTLFE